MSASSNPCRCVWGLEDHYSWYMTADTLLQQEASVGCRRLIAPGRYDSADQVDEAGFRQEVLQIYQTARPETRRLYDLGVVTGPDGAASDNWVVR